MRIALAQINSYLGAFEDNCKKIINASHRAKDRRCDVVVFPEAALFGYHPMDLLERDSIIAEQLKYLKIIKQQIPKDILVIFGAFTRNSSKNGKPYFNSAVAIQKGKKIFLAHKELLPTYDVFDDARHIEPGKIKNNIIQFRGKKILITICEDIWAWPHSIQHRKSNYSHNPIQSLRPKSVDLVVNLSASPAYVGKLKKRKAVVMKTAKWLRAPVIYVNMVGAQDELIFDGASFAVSAQGKTLTQAAQFQEDLCIFDSARSEGERRPILDKDIELIHQGLVLGLRDFVFKTGQRRVHLGLSGGIDSAVVACLAVDALGADNVKALALPGPYSSPQSLALAKKLAKNLGIELLVLDIKKHYKDVYSAIKKIMGPPKSSLVSENLQSRLRGILLMAMSNQLGSLLLNTSNKTELACGYGTIYGDMIGALSPIGDLLKKDVVQLANYYNSHQELIPKLTITREPTAELKKNQKDSDSLPRYSVLDASVERVIEKMSPPRNSVDQFLLKALNQSEFKRWQAPPILKIKEHSFGRGRRIPIAHKALK